MAFLTYITLDGYRYKTLAKQWKPALQRPASARLTLLGDLEATFGVGTLQKWEGIISTSHGEAAPGAPDGTLPGNIFTLRASLAKTEMLAFIDHNEKPYQVVATGPFDEQSSVNVWSSSANKYYVRVLLSAKGSQ